MVPNDFLNMQNVYSVHDPWPLWHDVCLLVCTQCFAFTFSTFLHLVKYWYTNHFLNQCPCLHTWKHSVHFASLKKKFCHRPFYKYWKTIFATVSGVFLDDDDEDMDELLLSPWQQMMNTLDSLQNIITQPAAAETGRVILYPSISLHVHCCHEN